MSYLTPFINQIPWRILQDSRLEYVKIIDDDLSNILTAYIEFNARSKY